MKKLVCVFLAVLQVLLLTACVGGNVTPTEPVDTIVYSYPSVIPTYVDDKELPMIAFWSPPSTEEWYQSMVDCGFTDVLIDSKYGNFIGSDQLLETLAICDKVGIGAYLTVSRGNNFTNSHNFAQFDSFKGLNTDEPLTKQHIDIIEKNIQILENSYQDTRYLTTFMPWLNSEMDFQTYESYLRYYMDHGGSDEEAVMFDIYPLKNNGIIENRWLPLLEEMAALSQKYGVDCYSYLATMSYGNSKRRPELDDMLYTSYVNLAYGMKGLGYFCYMSPGLPPYDGEFAQDEWAMVYYTDPNDFSTYYKTPTWEIVQTANQELKALDHVILSFDWHGVMKSIGSNAQTSAGVNNFTTAKNWIRKHDGIKKFTSTEDALLGVFKDKNGYDGFMLVNFADTYYDRKNTVTLELRGATRAMIYIKGQPQIVDLTDGTYTVTLEPGEGQFIIPLS